MEKGGPRNGLGVLEEEEDDFLEPMVGELRKALEEEWSREVRRGRERRLEKATWEVRGALRSQRRRNWVSRWFEGYRQALGRKEEEDRWNTFVRDNPELVEVGVFWVEKARWSGEWKEAWQVLEAMKAKWGSWVVERFRKEEELRGMPLQ